MVKRNSTTAPPSARLQVLEGLFQTLETPLLHYAYRLTHHHETAQDIVQQAFLNLQTHLDTVNQPRPWLYTTVHHLAMDHLKRSQRAVNPSQCETESDTASASGIETVDPSPLPDAQLEYVESIGLTRLSIEKLKPKQREVIQLKFHEGLSYKEIAAATGLSISNVGYILHQALQSLALELKLLANDEL